MNLFLWLPGQYDAVDLFLLPIYLTIIFLFAFLLRPKERSLKHYYRGLFLKLLGGFMFWLVHCLIYKV